MDKKLNRRDFLRTAVIVSGAALAACAPQPQKTVEVTKVVEKQVGDITVKVIITGQYLTEADAIKEAMLFTVFLQNYNLKKNGTTVIYEAWVTGNDYATKLKLMTASGELGNTVVWGNWAGVAGYVNDNVMIPLDDLMKAANISEDGWFASGLNLLKYDKATKVVGKGSLYGLPTLANPGAAFLFYNLDVLKAAGVSAPTDTTTLKELAEMGQTIKDKTGAFGLNENLWGTTHGWGWDNGYVGPFGGWILDETGTKCLINSAECLEAYNYIYEQRFVKKTQPTPDDYKAMGDYKQGTEAAKLAMYKMGSWGGSWISLRPENKNPEMGFSLFPATYDGRTTGHRGNTMGVDWWGVSSNAKAQKECFDVLAFFTSKDAALHQLKIGGGVQTRADVEGSPELAESRPIDQATFAAVKTAEVERDPANHRTEVNDALTQAMAPFDTGQQKPDKAWLDKLAGDIQKALDMPAA